MPFIMKGKAPTKQDRADTRLRCTDPENDSRGPRRGWMAQLRAMKDCYLFEAEEAEAWARTKKEWKEGRLEEMIALIWGTTLGVDGAGGSKYPDPDVAETERIVAVYPSVNLDTLRKSPRNRASDYTQAQIIEAITYPKQLICAGLAFNAPTVWPIETILGKRSELLPMWEFIVANPMSKRMGRTKGTHDKPPRDYERTDDNACLEENRRWLIVECDFAKERDGKPTIWFATIEKWEAQGITVKDAAARILFHLLTTHHQKVALVVDSGGKSLHCWINARAFEPGKMKEFQDHACKLGADWRSYLLSQWVRFPGGSRRKDDGAVARQEILYFDPLACPGKERPEGTTPPVETMQTTNL